VRSYIEHFNATLNLIVIAGSLPFSTAPVVLEPSMMVGALKAQYDGNGDDRRVQS